MGTCRRRIDLFLWLPVAAGGYRVCSRSRSSLGARLAVGRVQGSLKQHNRQREGKDPGQGQRQYPAMIRGVLSVETIVWMIGFFADGGLHTFVNNLE